MCLGIPGEVVEIHPEQPDLAKVNVSGVKRLINIGLLADDPPKPGEWVLIHVGFALSKIDEAEAAAAMAFLEGIGRGCDLSTNSVTRTRPARSPQRSRHCASRAGSTSSWRCAAGTPTRSTSTASRTTCPSRSRSCTGPAARSA